MVSFYWRAGENQDMKLELKLCRICGIVEVWSKTEQKIFESLCPECNVLINGVKK